VHCGEGTDDKSKKEFATLGSAWTPAGCLYSPKTAITHGTAFGAAEFAVMADKGMKLTWSPASNVALYGATTNVPLALDANVLVALAPDWSMGGSQNLLDELRFARDFSDKNWNGRLGAKDLVTMATSNGAKIVALDDQIGQIKEGYVADLAVYAGDASQPYDAIVAATPKDVRMVMVGGVVLYGDEDFERLAPTDPGCEKLDVCGASKFLCAATASGDDKLGQTFAEIKDALEKAMVAADEATPGDGYDFAPLAPLVRCK
jgi:cytosine/adenosine deaminase-related metal-dependent hydrolase